VARGSTVSYWVSKGVPQVTVPDLSGLTQSQAIAALNAAGLTLGGVGQDTSPTVPVGEVISQNPAANATVDRGSAVAIVLSSGTPTPSASPSGSPTPTGTPTDVPSVVTMPQTTAEQTLTQAGFTVDVKFGAGSLGPGTVYKQNPKAGATAAGGSTVTIWVGK